MLNMQKEVKAFMDLYKVQQLNHQKEVKAIKDMVSETLETVRKSQGTTSLPLLVPVPGSAGLPNARSNYISGGGGGNSSNSGQPTLTDTGGQPYWNGLGL